MKRLLLILLPASLAIESRAAEVNPKSQFQYKSEGIGMAKFAADDQRAQLAQSRTAAARWLVQAPLVTQEDRIDGSTQELETYKAASGLAHRTDLVTFFDYYEVDEGRRA